MSASMTRDRAVYWLAVHALNELHEHRATPRGCGPDCKPSIFGPEDPECCPDCCGPCGALEWLRDADREWLDDLIRTHDRDPEAHGWCWQDPETRGVNWEFVARCWNSDTCWHNELDDDEDGTLRVVPTTGTDGDHSFGAHYVEEVTRAGIEEPPADR